MRIPKALENVIESFERLPGIGVKSATRLGFYLLHVPQNDLEDFALALTNLKKNTKMCKTCFNIGTTEICDVCSDNERETDTVCVVEDALDVIAFEKSDKFKGVYHVLHGVIDPLNSLGPDDIYIPQLVKRISGDDRIKEIIVATNPTMEGEATAMYIVKEVRKISPNMVISRIGRGLPVGADIEYADEVTLSRALEGRREY
jgi:recombination protein RecR